MSECFVNAFFFVPEEVLRLEMAYLNSYRLSIPPNPPKKTSCIIPHLIPNSYNFEMTIRFFAKLYLSNYDRNDFFFL